ncbi:TrgA family protein [Rhodobacteraceae bacterium 2CG4]|uniref:TrgA family protein n=1 Tax=Halovulum marinum TaxID=2662447 RepID=A0A6L5Z1T2_9RHOB|nr:TrgA family protein [Halovulum marinum]MSU90523.1 TrgA family protein [Halovulum marinum]
MPQPVMPTAARMVAALALCAVSLLMVLVLNRFYPEEEFWRDWPEMFYLFGAVGFLVGWKSTGRRIAEEGGTGIGLGLRAAVTVAAWILFILSANHLWQQIGKARLRGEDPKQAVYLMAEKFMEYGTFMLNLKLVLIAAFMGITVGVLVRNTHHRWR